MKKNDFNVFLLFEHNGTTHLRSLADKADVYVDMGDLLAYGIDKKRLNQYLFRHKEIKKTKMNGRKLVQAAIISYLFKSMKQEPKK